MNVTGNKLLFINYSFVVTNCNVTVSGRNSISRCLQHAQNSHNLTVKSSLVNFFLIMSVTNYFISKSKLIQ